jgi:hypothetical protein
LFFFDDDDDKHFVGERERKHFFSMLPPSSSSLPADTTDPLSVLFSVTRRVALPAAPLPREANGNASAVKLENGGDDDEGDDAAEAISAQRPKKRHRSTSTSPAPPEEAPHLHCLLRGRPSRTPGNSYKLCVVFDFI